MGLRTKIVLGLFALCLVVGYTAYSGLFDHIRPQFLRIMEDGMVEQAYLLTKLVERKLPPDGSLREIATTDFGKTMQALRRERLHARIYEWEKKKLDTRVFLLDVKGIVRYDSSKEEVGKDYSRWNDVVRALRDEYGARSSSLMVAEGQRMDAMFVSFPLKRSGRIVGVLTLCRSKSSLVGWARRAQSKLFRAVLIGGVIVFLCAWLLTQAILHPIFRLTQYARDVTQGHRVPPPSIGRDEIGELTQAFVEMKTSLLERQDLERFVTQLTHELKSPISAIQGAAELLEDEAMPANLRERFLSNIHDQARRMNDIVQRLLLLVSLEQREALERSEQISISSLLKDICERFSPQAQKQGIRLITHIDPNTPDKIKGDAFLIAQALANLLQNALHFTPHDGEITLSASRTDDGSLWLHVTDTGAGIPDYALPRVLERFYSLEHPDSGKKGTGLGLPFVRQVALLHGGDFTIDNRPEGGVSANLFLPVVL